MDSGVAQRRCGAVFVAHLSSRHRGLYSKARGAVARGVPGLADVKSRRPPAVGGTHAHLLESPPSVCQAVLYAPIRRLTRVGACFQLYFWRFLSPPMGDLSPK